MANGAVRKETVYGILFVRKYFEYRVQLCEDHQAQMRRDHKQFECPAGPYNPRVTEDQGAQSVIVNLRHPHKIEDDVHISRFRKRDYRRAQDCFRFAYCQVTSYVENPYPFFF